MLEFNFSMTELQEGKWVQKSSKYGLCGCLKSAKVIDIVKTVRNGDSFICYNKDKKIIMYRLTKSIFKKAA